MESRDDVAELHERDFFEKKATSFRPKITLSVIGSRDK
jgi:hypothetical protein